MKLVIIGVVALVLLGGGGFAAWYFLMAEEDGTETAEEVMPDWDPQFIELDSFEVPIMVDGRVTHRVSFKLYLDLLPEHTEKSLKPHMTKIQDAVYSELHSLFGLRLVRDMPDLLPIVKNRVQMAANRVLGSEAVGAVLISNIHKKRTLRHHHHEITSRGRAGRGIRTLPSITRQ